MHPVEGTAPYAALELHAGSEDVVFVPSRTVSVYVSRILLMPPVPMTDREYVPAGPDEEVKMVSEELQGGVQEPGLKFHAETAGRKLSLLRLTVCAVPETRLTVIPVVIGSPLLIEPEDELSDNEKLNGIVVVVVVVVALEGYIL